MSDAEILFDELETGWSLYGSGVSPWGPFVCLYYTHYAVHGIIIIIIMVFASICICVPVS